MKKIFLGLAAALMLTACNENRQPEATTSVDSASMVTDLMMSRRSIRAYKDSVIRFSCTHRFDYPSRGKGQS